MSIFPKRTLLQKGVTIHWNFNTAHLQGMHIFPLVRLGVKRPDGKVTMLFEGNILALPDTKEEEKSSVKEYKYLNKNTPLLVLADYLSGQSKREVLVDILTAIQSGRHYYFHYPIPPDAPLGKYELISEVHSNGHVRYSKTVKDDFFFVEKLEVKRIDKQLETYTAIVKNASPEPIPVKIIECVENEGNLATSLQVFEIPPMTEFPVSYRAQKTFLLYNEEREILSLVEGAGTFSLRDQQMLTLSKNEEAKDVLFVVPKEGGEAYKLEAISKEIWLKADGINPTEIFKNNNDYKEIYEELVQSGLIQEIRI